MEIPKQLQNENFRFCKIKNGTKAPEEKCWQSWNNHLYYNEDFKQDRDAYGIVCGIGGLYVIDFDEQQIQDELLIKLPKTFAVKTGGKGLYHLYFTDNSKLPLSYQINNKENKRVLDIQGNGKQVIGTNSKHAETKRLYEVVNDIPIIEFPQQELLKLLEDLDFKYNLYGGSGTGTNARLTQCKFHDDHDPSMAIYQDNGTFYCFGCRAYGFIEALNYKGKLNKKETKNGTFYYIEKEDIEKFMKPFTKEENIIKENIDIDLKDIYENIIKVLKFYCDLKEENYSLIAVWIIGTYFYKNFSTYPYLYFNAPKGSGKTRLLKLIAKLSYNGDILVSISESVLFRTAGDSTICIDEFESLHGKEKQVLRELLNAGYKKGLGVKRAIKVKGIKEKYEIERYDVYSPKAMANIWGMDEVLGDRSITLILDKSNNPLFTRKVEDFEENDSILNIKQQLNQIQCSLCSVVTEKKINSAWNMYTNTYVDNKTTLYTNNTNNINYINYTNIFDKIYKSEIEGRNLELFLPLFFISSNISDYLIDLFINIAKESIKERKQEDITENRDILLLDLICDMEETIEFIKVAEITKKLKEIDESDFINSKYIGRALRRLNLIIEKRRLGKGIEVKIDFKKAHKKILIFRTIEKPKQESLKEYTEEEVKDES